MLGFEKSYSKSCAGKYRYGYQGKYAEKDDETGWNHFELREYDAVIGRWFQTDPEGQHYSSYIGMGNNPVSGTDPNGGWVKGAGLWNNLFKSDSRIHAERYASSWSSSTSDYFAAKAGDAWGLYSVDKTWIGGFGQGSERYESFTPVNKDGSLGEVDGAFIRSTPSPGNIDFDPLGQLSFAPGFGAAVGIPARSALVFAGRTTVTLASRYALSRSVANFNSFMTAGELRAFTYTGSAGVRAMMRGKGIDAAFRYYAGNNFILRGASHFGLIRLGARNLGADMVGTGSLSGYWWDVTTIGRWNSHVAKYGSGGTGLIYK